MKYLLYFKIIINYYKLLLSIIIKVMNILYIYKNFLLL